MKQADFLAGLPNQYHNWGTDLVQPRSPQFQTALTQIQGMTTANVMQLLNWAVGCLEGDEIYCEVGTYVGSTLIGALLNRPAPLAYAVDNFAEYNPSGENFSQLLGNLEQFDLTNQVYFFDQDFEQFFFDLRELEEPPEIGVYFYDGAHDYRSVLVGLLLAKPFLADNALILVDDYNWATVQQAVWDFIASHNQCESVAEILTPVARYPSFWNGIKIISWRQQELPYSDRQKQDQKFRYFGDTFATKRQPRVIRDIYDLQMLEQSDENRKALYHEAVYCHQQGQWGLAKEKYQKFLIWYQDHADAWLGLGTVYLQTEQYQDARNGIEKAIALEPDDLTYYYYLGLALEKLGQFEQAIAAYQRTCAEPNAKTIEAYNNLGLLYQGQGTYTQAEAIYRQAIHYDSSHAGTHLNLGNLFLALGQIECAISTYEQALQQVGQHQDLLNNLSFAQQLQKNPGDFHLRTANQLYQSQHYGPASQQYKITLGQGICHESLYLNYAECLFKQGQGTAGLEILGAGIQQFPHGQELHFYRINHLLQLGNKVEIYGALEFALDCLPQSHIIKINYYLFSPVVYESIEEIHFYRARFQLGLKLLGSEIDWQDEAQVNELYIALGRFTPFFLTYQARNIVWEQRQYGQLVHRVMQAKYPQWCQPRDLIKQAKIRVGYLSHYLHSYSGTLWLTGWLQYCDPERFEIYCYYTGNQPDPITELFRHYSSQFHHIPHDFVRVCQQVIADQIQILVFPEIGMDATTIQMAALRLAPIQCTAWGHPVTSGLPTIDYYLSSELMEPSDSQEHYQETLVKLPHLGITYPQPMVPEPTQSRPYFGLRPDGIVYLCCQAPFKYLPHHDYLLATIALAVPDSQFVFIRADILKPRLAQAFTQVGLDYQDYCIFLAVQPRNDYLSLNQLSDVYLDTLGFNGGNTTLDALACGLPVVTCSGKLMRGRLSTGMLNRIDVMDTIATTEQEYIHIATRLGLDQPWRQEIQAKIRKSSHLLFEDQDVVKALETFYLKLAQA
jgi:predicted O-linked N-acetylglucosamine transferase (SPINDLY family)